MIRLIAVSSLAVFMVATATFADVVVLDGGTLPQDQGWDYHTTIVGPLDVSTDGTALTLNTIGMPSLSQPMMTFYRDVGIDPAAGYAIEIRLRVIAVADPHNAYDAPIGFFGGFTSPWGAPYRGQLLYFDEDEIGWGDLSDSTAMDTTDAFHDYRLEVLANNRAFMFVDGALALEYPSYGTNSTIAFGDATNGPYLDGTFSVEYITVGAVCQTEDRPDCNANGVWDFCDLAAGDSADCNGNGIPDECDIADGTSADCNGNGVPDECPEEPDCNDNGVPDDCDIAAGTSEDCTGNGIPDECEPDCNENGVADSCDIAEATSVDCQPNGIPDECDIAEGTSWDVNETGIPDECEMVDCNHNGIPDETDLADCDGSPWCDDCNQNTVLDGCDVTDESSPDSDADGVPDECQLAPPTMPAWPDDVVKNRFISFVPGDLDIAVAYQVELVDSSFFPDCTGVVGYVDIPDPENSLISRVVPEPIYRFWPEPIARVGDCRIVPAASYRIRAVVPTEPISRSDPLSIDTTPSPYPKYWCDCVGGFDGVWQVPDGVVNMNDLMAAMQTFQWHDNRPPVTWCSIYYLMEWVNMADILIMVRAFEGSPYPFCAPCDCE